jgi:hypothetical protein
VSVPEGESKNDAKELIRYFQGALERRASLPKVFDGLELESVPDGEPNNSEETKENG